MEQEGHAESIGTIRVAQTRLRLEDEAAGALAVETEDLHGGSVCTDYTACAILLRPGQRCRAKVRRDGRE